MGGVGAPGLEDPNRSIDAPFGPCPGLFLSSRSWSVALFFSGEDLPFPVTLEPRKPEPRPNKSMGTIMSYSILFSHTPIFFRSSETYFNVVGMAKDIKGRVFFRLVQKRDRRVGYRRDF